MPKQHNTKYSNQCRDNTRTIVHLHLVHLATALSGRARPIKSLIRGSAATAVKARQRTRHLRGFARTDLATREIRGFEIMIKNTLPLPETF